MSWEQLASIEAEARALANEDATQQPRACPNDGEPLVTGSDGKLFCRWDGWRPSE